MPTSRMTQIADAIRNVTRAMQTAIADGYRSRAIDADDLAEVLLAIADRLDSPVPGTPVRDEPPPLLAAARALLDARDCEMVTHVEWDRLREAVEHLTPPVENAVAGELGCPECGERDADRMAVDETDATLVYCMTCGATFDPAAG